MLLLWCRSRLREPRPPQGPPSPRESGWCPRSSWPAGSPRSATCYFGITPRVSRGRSMSNRSPRPAAPAAADRVWRASFASVCRPSCCSRSSSASSPRAKRVAGAARASRDAPRRPGPRRSANRPARDGANSARTTLRGGLARTPVPHRPQRARSFRLGREAEQPPLRREGIHDHQGLLPDAGRAGIRSMRAAGR